MHGFDEQANEKRKNGKRQKTTDKQAPPTCFKVSNRLTLSLVLEEVVAEKEEEEEKEKEEEEEEEVQTEESLSVASGPSVEVGEGGDGLITRGNGVRDCDEGGKRNKGDGARP